MKILILAATAALLASPVLAQSPAVQGRTGSSAGGYQTDPSGATGAPNTGGSTTSGSATTGSSGGMMNNQAGGPATTGSTATTVPPAQQGSGSNSGGYGPTRQ